MCIQQYFFEPLMIKRSTRSLTFRAQIRFRQHRVKYKLLVIWRIGFGLRNTGQFASSNKDQSVSSILAFIKHFQWLQCCGDRPQLCEDGRVKRRSWYFIKIPHYYTTKTIISGLVQTLVRGVMIESGLPWRLGLEVDFKDVIHVVQRADKRFVDCSHGCHTVVNRVTHQFFCFKLAHCNTQNVSILLCATLPYDLWV